jgi:hypothetical protein
MRQQRHHGALAIHYFEYLMTAYGARNRAAKAIADDPASMPSDAIIAIVFSAFGVEAFINELGEMAQRDADLSPGVHGTGTLLDLALILMEIEEASGSVELKYQMTSRVLSGRTFPKDHQPFQGFRDLMKLRDALVHVRQRDTTDPTGRISPSLKIVKQLQQSGLTRTRGRKPTDPPGGMSWLDELKTTAVATWAYQAACNIVRAVGQMITDAQITTSGIQALVDKLAQLPTVSE